MTRLAVEGRVLVLVAGMPGAGKSTLLRGLAARPGLRVLDSETYRARLGSVLRPLPYRYYRPLVHLWHRLAALVALVSRTPTVLVHLPATDRRTRAVVAALARWTGRRAHLLWLHVDPQEALRGQQQRGRLIPSGSFAAHVELAAATSALLGSGRPEPGWTSATVLDRATAARGLSLVTEPEREEPRRGDPAGGAPGGGAAEPGTGPAVEPRPERARARPRWRATPVR
jgi:predicted kinase